MNTKQYEIYRETKEHTPLDFPYNTYLCSIPLDFSSVKIHWHDDIEIIVIKKGEGIICVDLDSYNVSAGDMIFIFPGQLHSIEQKDDCIMEYENIIFKPGLLKSSGADLCSDNFLKPLFSGQIRLCPVITSPNIRALIDEIDTLRQTKPHGYELGVKANLFNIIFQLITDFDAETISAAKDRTLEKMKTVLTYVAENYQNDFSIDEVAKLCHYSNSHFMRFFKKNMGISFIQYLNDHRLEMAAFMLIETNDNILEIAENVGFDNLSYFNRSFKKKYGTTPGKYRKKA